MRLPNGYGSIVNLGKRRRRPFAVRIHTGYKKNSKDTVIPTYKYLAYFEKREDALGFLAKYNAGQALAEHMKYVKKPTFSEVYDEWLQYKTSRSKKPGESSLRGYKLGFDKLEPIHHMLMINLRHSDIQPIVDQYRHKSRGTVGNIKTVLFGVFEYAIKQEYIEKDYSKLIDFEWSEEVFIQRTIFSSSEIKKLWSCTDVPNVDLVLLMIYTGMRATELCKIRTENVHLDERYLIGGIKTEAGTNRYIPIHERIVPIIEKHYNPDHEYLFNNTTGEPLIYKTLLLTFNEVMKNVGMDHRPHDTRHTCASLMDNAGVSPVSQQRILGHSNKTVTQRYIHKDIQTLIEEINKIK